MSDEAKLGLATAGHLLVLPRNDQQGYAEAASVMLDEWRPRW